MQLYVYQICYDVAYNAPPLSPLQENLCFPPRRWRLPPVLFFSAPHETLQGQLTETDNQTITKKQYFTFETHLKSNQKRDSFHSFVERDLMSPERNRLYSSSPAPLVISWRVGFVGRELHFEDFECFEQSIDISSGISC